MKISGKFVFWFAIFILLVLLEITVSTRLISPAIFAKPSEIVQGVYRLIATESFAVDIWYTTGLSILGVLIGFPFGCAIGVTISVLGSSQKSAEYLLDFIRSIPLTTLVPVFLVIYGIGYETKVAIAAIAAALITAVTMLAGVKSAVKKRTTILALYKPRRYKKYKYVLFADTYPSIISAVRLSISTAIILVVVAEMFIGTKYGVGKVILDKGYTDDVAGQYAAIFVIGLIGFILNLLFMPSKINPRM